MLMIIYVRTYETFNGSHSTHMQLRYCKSTCTQGVFRFRKHGFYDYPSKIAMFGSLIILSNLNSSTGIVVFVNLLNKIDPLAAMPELVGGQGTD